MVGDHDDLAAHGIDVDDDDDGTSSSSSGDSEVKADWKAAIAAGDARESADMAARKGSADRPAEGLG